MTYEEFVQYVERVLPGASIGQDNESQLVIYTGMVRTSNDQVRALDGTF